MKSALLFLFVFSFAGPLMADAKKVIGRSMTCIDLQDLLTQEKQLFIILGPFDWGNDYFSTSDQCGPKKDPIGAYVKSSDKRWCYVGWTCTRRP